MNITHPMEFSRDVTVEIQGELRPAKFKILGVEEVEPEKFKCYWSLDHLMPEPSYLYGQDPLDAVLACSLFVGQMIKGTQEDGHMTIWWEEPGDFGGLAADRFFSTDTAPLCTRSV